jgi:hypothetical protein
MLSNNLYSKSKIKQFVIINILFYCAYNQDTFVAIYATKVIKIRILSKLCLTKLKQQIINLEPLITVCFSDYYIFHIILSATLQNHRKNRLI